MYKYAIVAFMALSSSAITPARAGGYGCFGGRLPLVAGFGGCGGISIGFGCQGYGCCGGFPVSYGCGGGFPVSYGCCGGSFGFGCQGSGWYGGDFPSDYGWSSSCFGGAPASYYTLGGYGISDTTPAPQVGAVIQGDRISRHPETLSSPRSDGNREPRVTNRQVQERDQTTSDAGRGSAIPNHATPVESAPAERIGAPEELANPPAPAIIVVRLPADATLSINDAATRSAAPTRTFVSPPLQPGKEFHYTLKAEAVRDGQKVTTSQRLTVRAGEKKEVVLEFGQRHPALTSAGRKE